MGLRRGKEAPRAAASRVQAGSAVFGRHFIFMGVPENHKNSRSFGNILDAKKAHGLHPAVSMRLYAVVLI